MERVVEPLANISASDLLNLVPACFGWVRKDDNVSSGIKSMVKPLVESMVKPLVDLGGCKYIHSVLTSLLSFRNPPINKLKS